MKLGNFLKTYAGQQTLVRLLVVLCLVLGGGLLVQSWGLARQSATVVVMPPTVKGSVSIDAYDSSPEYKTAWGLFFAGLVGNVTPAKLPFIRDTLEQFVAPAIFHDAVQRLEVEAAAIEREQTALSFDAQRVEYDRDRNLVIVEGISTLKPAIGREKRGPRTYEFEIEILNYRPVLRSMSTYEGARKQVENAH